MRAFFSDHAGEILTDRVAAVREDHNDHPDRDKGAEDLHDAGGGEASLDHERVDAKHDQHRRIFVEVLDGDRAARAHQNKAAVLKEGVHRHYEEAGKRADKHHDAARDDDRPGDFKTARKRDKIMNNTGSGAHCYAKRS